MTWVKIKYLVVKFVFILCNEEIIFLIIIVQEILLYNIFVVGCTFVVLRIQSSPNLVHAVTCLLVPEKGSKKGPFPWGGL